jgi:hypothetical protein
VDNFFLLVFDIWVENTEIKKEKNEQKIMGVICYTEAKYVIERRKYETEKTNPGDAFSGVYGIWGNDSI